MSSGRKRLAIACVLALKLVEEARKLKRRRRHRRQLYEVDSDSEWNEPAESDFEDLDESFDSTSELSQDHPLDVSEINQAADGNRTQATGSGESSKKGRVWAKVYFTKEDFLNLEERLLIALVSDVGEGPYKNVCKITADQFYYILEKVEPYIAKKDTLMRHAVPAKLRLVITLKFMFHAETFISMNKATGISAASLSRIIPDVMHAILKYIGPEVMKTPQTADDWLQISEGFNTVHNFPHILGSLQAQFIKTSSGKKCENDVAIIFACDSNYRIIFDEVIGTGSTPEFEIHEKSVFIGGLRNGSLNLPQPDCLEDGLAPIPYFFVANNSFRLNDNLLIPYDDQTELNGAELIFNRKITDPAFVSQISLLIMANRFRALTRTITMLPDTLCHLFRTIFVLYNYLLDASELRITENFGTQLPDTFRSLKLQMRSKSSNVRSQLAEHFLEKENKKLVL